jgi:hypothetical protein
MSSSISAASIWQGEGSDNPQGVFSVTLLILERLQSEYENVFVVQRAFDLESG